MWSSLAQGPNWPFMDRDVCNIVNAVQRVRVFDMFRRWKAVQLMQLIASLIILQFKLLARFHAYITEASTMFFRKYINIYKAWK